MSQPFISILIPVFNTESYLPRCLDSIFRQSFREFEIILVDDASTDGSLRIAQEYAKRDSRLKIIALPENSGRDNARLAAIKTAVGEYIVFCDSDDELLPDFLKKIAEYAKTGCDVIVFGRTKVCGSQISTAFKCLLQNWTLKHRQILTGTEIFRTFFLERKFAWALWGKCIKANLLDYYIPLKIGNCTAEDFLRIMILLYYAKTLLYVRDQGYVYHYGAGICGRKTYNLSQIQVFANSCQVYSAAECFLKEKRLPEEYFSMLKNYREENLVEVLRMSTNLPAGERESGQKVLYDIWGEALYFQILSRYLGRAERQYTESIPWKMTKPLRWLYDILLYRFGGGIVQKFFRSQQ